jgi:glutamate synthase (NADPH/NADH) small chain
MGKPTGFLEWRRELPGKRAIEERVHDFRELVLDRTPTEMRRQGGRCMDCGVPFCHQGCPLGNPIPDFNELVFRDRWRAAYEVLATTNDFPEITGRICPAPCEQACVLAFNDQPVTIEQIEKEIIERAFAQGWVRPNPPAHRTGKRVAVVGSGPAGLAAATRLNQAGHEVVVYEAADRIGGLLRYGIPDFKLDRAVLDRRLQVLEAEGVRFLTGHRVGEAPTWAELREAHDAMIVAVGAQRPREITVPGRELSGIHFAMDYLEQQNRRVAGDPEVGSPILAAGKRVVVIGGGDTGADCHGTALRQGAVEVTSLEIAPQPPTRRPGDNPWPQWPMTLRTSTSHEEGGTRAFSVSTTGFVDDGKGGVAGLRLTRVEAVTQGGRTRFEAVPGSEYVLPAELVLLAMGFVGAGTQSLVEQLGVAVDGAANVKVDKAFATNVPGVFAAGDAVRGPSLVVWGLAQGREAARGVDAWLRGGEAWVPTRGRDLSFGGR